MNGFRSDWRSAPAPFVRHALRPSPTLDAPAPAGLGAIAIGPGTDRVASFFGTDRKTFLLVGGAGLILGYILHSAAQSTNRGLRRGTRRARTKLGQLATGRNLAILGAVAIAGGAAYLYYQHRRHEPTAAAPAHQPAHNTYPLPVKSGTHWTRPQ